MNKVDCFNLGILVGIGIYAFALKLATGNYLRFKSYLTKKEIDQMGEDSQ